MSPFSITFSILTLIALGLLSCDTAPTEKGFQVQQPLAQDDAGGSEGTAIDSLSFPTRVSNVLLTGIPQYRLATVYKLNLRKNKPAFIGSNQFHYRYAYYDYEDHIAKEWNGHLMPGLEAVYGYNMVNIAHFDNHAQQQKNLFEKPVLVKTLYYPSFESDSLNNQPVLRKYFLVSVYDEDTNKDGKLTMRDLRRLYSFSLDGAQKAPVVPTDYSVYKSEYDPANDLMYVFARADENRNGQIEDPEPASIFWVDLKDPRRTGKQYQAFEK